MPKLPPGGGCGCSKSLEETPGKITLLWPTLGQRFPWPCCLQPRDGEQGAVQHWQSCQLAQHQGLGCGQLGQLPQSSALQERPKGYGARTSVLFPISFSNSTAQPCFTQGN